MRSSNKYLIKVQDELDVYRRHLLFGDELTPTQSEVLAKVNICRAWLKDGYSDSKVLDLLKNDPMTRLQERRAREVLVMAYDLYADLRQARNEDGIKYLYADIFREAADLVYRQAKSAFEDGNREEGAELMKQFKGLMAEAADLDWAYKDKVTDMSGKKKPTKVTLKRVTKIINGQTAEDKLTEEADYEQL
jgi:hypothetical protein